MGTEEIKKDNDSWFLNLTPDQWVALPVSGPSPSGRYKHGAAVIGEKLYISGGSRNGRNLADIQVLNLTDFTWSSLVLTVTQNEVQSENGSIREFFPAVSGHDMIAWGRKLLLVGGQSKKHSDYVTVRFVDTETRECGVVETSGEFPVARTGQSVTLVGSKLAMFGGEDNSRRLLNDVHVLDLNSMTWSKEVTQKPPSPRYDHAATVFQDHLLLVFGGSSHSTCFNDLHWLNLNTMEWTQPETHGDFVTPRAGHSGPSINNNWFIVGGGDNKTGAVETLVFDFARSGWSLVTRVSGRDPLASEGIRVCYAPVGGQKYLVAFGGYNGKYNNEVFVMKPTLKEPPPRKILLSPAAAAAAASVSAAYSVGSARKASMGMREIPFERDGDFEIEHPQQDFSFDIDMIREEKKALESLLAEIGQENSKMRDKLDDAKSTTDDLSKELASVQGQLVEERSRCFKLEAQIAELQGMLQVLPSVEAEVLSLRKQISEFEKDVELATAQKQASRGVWQWIAS